MSLTIYEPDLGSDVSVSVSKSDSRLGPNITAKEDGYEVNLIFKLGESELSISFLTKIFYISCNKKFYYEWHDIVTLKDQNFQIMFENNDCICFDTDFVSFYTRNVTSKKSFKYPRKRCQMIFEYIDNEVKKLETKL